MVPPFDAVAVKVTEVPWQNGLAEATMETPAASSELTTILIGLETTVRLPLTQIALDVTWQVTISPLIGINDCIELLDLL